MIKLSALGSGSKGNALVVTFGNDAIIVDVGFSRKEIKSRMEQLALNPAKLRAALLTHEHDDHVRGCRVFCNDLGIPLCASAVTAEYLRKKEKLPERVLEFEPGGNFRIGGFSISPFAVQHDAIDPVGFVIRCGHAKIGVATDLGDVNALAEQSLRDCDALVLESNYDEKMLRDSDRQPYLKRRILGRHGHLDNLVALGSLERLLTARTKILLLAHLSCECNSPELVQTLFRKKLCELNREDVIFHIIRQDSPLEPIEFQESEL